jgi:hypothetical protein
MSAPERSPPPDDFEVTLARAEWGQAIQDLMSLRKALQGPGGEDLRERAREAEKRLRSATTRLARLTRGGAP